MTDDPSVKREIAPGEVTNVATDDPFANIPDETVYLPPRRIEMQRLPPRLREEIGQRGDREGFCGYAVELANMPQDVPDGWFYIAVYGGGAKAGCMYVDRRYSERCIEGMEIAVGPAWFDVDNVEDAARLFLEILRDGGWVD